MTNTKELIEELRVQANQHPCDADLIQFDIAATALEQLEARCAQLERELEWIQTKYNTEMRIRQAYQSGSEEVARKAFVDGANWCAQCEQNDTLHLDEHEAADEYIEQLKEQIL
jgi:hypothetical protein